MSERRRLHVLQLITRADWGGAQRHVLDLATGTDADHFQVTVACAPDGPLVERLQQRGIAVVPLPALQRDLSVLNDRQALSTIVALLRERQVDLLHCHSSKAGFLGRLAARRTGVRAVYTAHGFAFGGQAASMAARAAYLAAEWWAGRFWTDHLITVSRADRDLALRWRIVPPERVTAVHNGVHLAEFAAAPPPGRHGGPPVVGVISRLVPGKGLLELLEAASLMLRHGAYRFIIAGEGPLRPMLEQRARDLGIAAAVAFPGFVDPGQFLARMDACALPSFKEGLPYSVLEAMAAGRPVVASDVGGLPEVIQHGENGLLVAPGDVRGLADGLREVLRPERLEQFSQRARQTIHDQFSVQQMVREIERIYASLQDSARSVPRL